MTEILTTAPSVPGVDEKKKYVGVVIDDADPLFLQRVRARVATVHDGIADEFLPWAIPDSGEQNNGATSTTGTVDVPLKGSKVCIRFQSGKLGHPMHSAYHTDATTVIEESKYNYPKRKVIRFKDGSILVVDVEDSVVYMRAAGNVKAYVEGNVELHIHGNVDERIDGNVRRIVKGNVDEIILGDHRRYVKGNFDEKIAGDVKQSFSKNLDVAVGGNDTETVKGNLEVTAASIHEHAQSDATMSAGSSALVYGAGSATLGSAGAVTVKGSSAAIQPGAAVSNPGSPSSAAGVNAAVECVLTDWPGFPGGERGR